MGYLGNHSVGVNVKHGKLEIELAVQGWYHAINVDDNTQEIEEGLVYAGKDKGLETLIVDTAYDVYGRVTSGKAIYRRGEMVIPTVPMEIIEEARDYLSKDKVAQYIFLRSIHEQVVLDKEGPYAERFRKREGEIAPILNYFADKLRDLGSTALADELEAKVKEKFPKLEMNVYEAPL